jgi:hypothetical protein
MPGLITSKGNTPEKLTVTEQDTLFSLYAVSKGGL